MAVRRALDVLATAATLALAGYAAVVFVRDVRELAGTAAAWEDIKVRRVLSWAEAVEAEQARRDGARVGRPKVLSWLEATQAMQAAPVPARIQPHMPAIRDALDIMFARRERQGRRF